MLILIRMLITRLDINVKEMYRREKEREKDRGESVATEKEAWECFSG